MRRTLGRPVIPVAGQIAGLPGLSRPPDPEHMHTKIADFSETELSVIRQTLAERFHKPVEVQLGDAEIRLDPSDRELTVVPVAFWSEGGANFAIFRAGDSDFRCQFFYRVHKQYGTGRDSYDDIGDCVVTLLQVQADHALKNAAEASR
jgi:hypothetical protein